MLNVKRCSKNSNSLVCDLKKVRSHQTSFRQSKVSNFTISNELKSVYPRLCHNLFHNWKNSSTMFCHENLVFLRDHVDYSAVTSRLSCCHRSDQFVWNKLPQVSPSWLWIGQKWKRIIKRSFRKLTSLFREQSTPREFSLFRNKLLNSVVILEFSAAEISLQHILSLSEITISPSPFLVTVLKKTLKLVQFVC